MTYRGIKIPKCNDRPQLWLRGPADHSSIRIIFPDGRVSWCPPYAGPRFFKDWLKHEGSDPACTESESQIQTIKNSIDYDLNPFDIAPIFCGYL